MRTLLAALTALMLFATPVVAEGDWDLKNLIEEYDSVFGATSCQGIQLSYSEIVDYLEISAK